MPIHAETEHPISRFNLSLFTVLLVFLQVSLLYPDEHPALITTEVDEALFGDDHMSEGVLLPMNDGRIRLAFRLDPGLEGHHVGTNGYIATSVYDTQADSWSEPESLYNSQQYDDRNIHGGVTREGRMVLFFRHYDGNQTRKRFYMYSDDRGETWTDPRTSDAWSYPETSGIRGVWSTGQMFYNPDVQRHMMLGCRRYVTCSRDGSRWERVNKITDDQGANLTEIAGGWVGDDTIVALSRDDRRERGHPLLQIVSRDNGRTWTDPHPTNMPPKKHWGCAPQLIYDASRNLIIALTSTRYSKPNDDQHLYIYTARPEDILDDPEGWTMQSKILRPWAREDWNVARPLNTPLYGYPTIARINRDEYLVVFTERARMRGTEQADLYSFRVKIRD